MAPGPESLRPPSSGRFETTCWTLVISANRGDDGGAALNRLCEHYWTPIYVYIRRSGLPPADAEDATQDFFQHVLDRNALRNTGEERGSFRGYLLAMLRHFLANRRRHETAQKRGGLMARTDLAAAEKIAGHEPDPALACERVWASCVIQAALDRLASEQARSAHAVRFRALRGFLTHAPSPADYDRLCAELGEPRNRIAVSLHRLTRRYAELIRAEIFATVSDPAEVEPELRRLLEVLAPAA